MAKKRTHSVSVLLTDEEFRRLESFCDGRGYKKSTLIAWLIREHLDVRQHEMRQTLPFPQLRVDE